MAKKIQCPKWTCRSTECIPLTDKKKYSAGKGVLGAAAGSVVAATAGLAAAPLVAVGALTGFNGKKKVKMMCTKCGNVFEVKL